MMSSDRMNRKEAAIYGVVTVVVLLALFALTPGPGVAGVTGPTGPTGPTGTTGTTGTTGPSGPIPTTTTTLPSQGEPVCDESFNPAGNNIPPAGLTLPGVKGGQNPDGFYIIGSTDGTDVCVTNTDGSAQFGPFESGSTVKLTEAPGKTPDEKPIGGPNSAVIDHITLDTDPRVCLVVSDVCSARCVDCLLPPPPK